MDVVGRVFKRVRQMVPLAAGRMNCGGGWQDQRGFTLVELLVVTVIIGALVAIALPNYAMFVNAVRNGRGVSEVRTLEREIEAYKIDREVLPPNLAAINRGAMKDPWGRLYVYSPVPTRTDGVLDLNTDFDIYSLGLDGNSQPSIGDPVSQDDIVRVNDGRMVVVGSSY